MKSATKRKRAFERDDERLTELWEFVNSWAEDRKHPEAREGNKMTEYGLGYQAACRDIYNKMEELGL